MLLTTATVVLSKEINEQEAENRIVFECGDLDEAAEWANEHSNSLGPGERYDIYYRCEGM